MNDDGTLSLAASQRAPAADAVPGTGERVGRFVIRSRIGEGGMGVVLAGHDPDLDRPVAIKLLRAGADTPAYRERLLREAQALARLDHPNVVTVYEVGIDRDRVYLAMELVAGVTLTQWVSARRRTWREVVAKFVAVGDGLAAVHRAGLVHRDFKPDNVLVDPTGRARVADFGLARLTASEGGATGDALAARLTRTGAVMGTPGYMAPEQQWGGDVDARADQYSFCVALRAALTGSTLTTASTIGDRDDPGAAERAAAAREWGKLPRRVRAVVTRGLAYDPAERYADMAALLIALRDTLASRRARIAAITASAVFAAGVVATSIAIAMHDTGGAGPAAAVTADAAPASGSGSAALAVATAGADAAPAPVPAPPAAPGAEPGPAAAPGSGSAPAARAAPVDPDGLPIVRVAFGDAGKNPQHPPAVLEAHAAGGAAVAPADDADRRRELAKIVGRVGYQGLDLAAVRADPAAVEAHVLAVLGRATAAGAVEEATIVLAMVRRYRGDCEEARGHALAVLTKGFWQPTPSRDELAALPRERVRWLGRAHLQIGLCAAKAALAGGDVKTAGGILTDTNMFLAVAEASDGERAELQLVLGGLAHESGRPTARGWIEAAERFGGSRIVKLAAAYRAAAGL